MNTPNHEAQRELEQRALKNVRGLVDKIEQGETADNRSQRRILAGILVLALAIAAGIGIYAWRAGSAIKPVVFDPAKLPPIKPGPQQK
jgi:ferric-dicitrate binding protein FerR (iron transport regulator)